MGWPNYGYDRATVSIVLSLDTILAVSCFISLVLLYHWSKMETDSNNRLHGERDGKFKQKKAEAYAYSLEKGC